MIELNKINKFFKTGDQEIQVLNDINLKVDKGEMIAIMGPSGSGKSTLLNILGCLDSQTSGNYEVCGKETTNLSSKEKAKMRNSVFGFVVQYFALIDDYTVYENVKLPLKYSTSKKKTSKKEIINLLETLGIGEKKDRYPSELSGGQSQRVAIARAMSNNPQIILADEPTGALDKKNGNDVMSIFQKLNKEGKTIIVVTHDEKIAKMCKRIILLEDGKIISDVKIQDRE